MNEEKQRETSENIIQLGLDQIERSSRISMNHELLHDAREVAELMRERLDLRATLACDWQGCDIKSESEPIDALIAKGWLHTPRRHNSTDFCPLHALPFEKRNWSQIEIEENYYSGSQWPLPVLMHFINQSNENLTLERELGDWFAIGFGGRGSCGTLAYSKDRAELEAILADDGLIEKLFDRHDA